MAVREAQGPPCAHVVALLDRHGADLDLRIAELVSARDVVGRLRQRAAELDPADCAADGICHIIPTKAHNDAVPASGGG